jgi:hypothetical protein
MVFKTLVFSPLNRLTRLIAQENFIILSRWESNKSQHEHLLLGSKFMILSRYYSNVVANTISLCNNMNTTHMHFLKRFYISFNILDVK